MTAIIDEKTLCGFVVGQYTDGNWFASYNGDIYTGASVDIAVSALLQHVTFPTLTTV